MLLRLRPRIAATVKRAHSCGSDRGGAKMVDWIKVVLIDKIFNPFTRPFRFVGTSLRQFYPFGNSSGNERTNPEPQRNKCKKCKWRKRTKRHERRPQSEESQSNPTSSSPLSLRPVQGAQRVCVQLKGRRKTLSLLNCPKPKVKRILRTKLKHASRARGWHSNVRSTPIFVLGQGARSS